MYIYYICFTYAHVLMYLCTKKRNVENIVSDDSNYGNNGYKSKTITNIKYKIIINYIVMILAYII